MNRRIRTLTLLVVVSATLLTLLAGPVLATEGGAEEGSEKVGLPETPRDRVGLIIFGAVGVAVLAAGINALRQLRGDRPQADGRIRWR